MVIYNKLVRDKIPKILKEKNLNPKTHIADETEYTKKLNEKLKEEINEFLESEDPEELADILEVIDAIAINKNISKSDLEIMKQEKANKKGKFKDKTILEEV